jgi:type II secretory pathway component PulF
MDSEYPKDLYAFRVPSINDKTEEMILPIPSEEIIPFLAKKLGAVDEPVKLTPLRARLKWSSAGPPKKAEIAAVCEAMSSLIGMEVEMVDSLAKAMEVTPNLQLRHALACAISDMFRGADAAEAFGKHPKVFDQSMVGQIAAAQRTNTMATTLEGIAAHIEMTQKVASATLVSLIYPFAVTVVLYLIIGGILYFLMPQLTEAFRAMNAKLPGPSLALVQAGKIVRKMPWTLLIGPAGLTICWVIRRVITGPIMSFLRVLPIFGQYYMRSQLSLTVATLANLLKSGIRLYDAIDLVAGSTSDQGVAKAYRRVKESLEAGDDPPHAFLHVISFFGKSASKLRSAIEIGFASSSLEKTLEKVSAGYQKDFLRASEMFGKLMGPLSSLVVGSVVGSIVLAAYYPILTASTNIK